MSGGSRRFDEPQAAFLRLLRDHPSCTLAVCLAAGLLPVLACLYAPLLLAFDDIYWTVQNPLIAHGLSHLGEVLSFPFRDAGGEGFQTAHWAPLSLLSLALEHVLFGQAGNNPPQAADFAPWAFRISQGLQHGLAAWFVLNLGARLCGRFETGFWAAALFLIHPTVCESVCWIGARTTLQAVLFGLAALYVYSGGDPGRPPSWPRTLGAMGLLLAATLCKGVAIAWWPVLVGWDLLVRHLAAGSAEAIPEASDPPGAELTSAAGGTRAKVSSARQGMWSALPRAAVLFLPVALALLVLRQSHADLLLPPLGHPPLGPWAISAWLMQAHLALLAFPVGLSVYYEFPVGQLQGAEWGQLVLGTLATAGLSWWSFHAGMPARRVVFYLLWIGVGIAPMINPFATLSFVLQDRYTYLSLAGFTLWLADFAFLVRPRARIIARRVVLALLCLVLAAMTLSRSRVWRDAEALVRDGAGKAPHSAFGHAYLAHLLFWKAAPNQAVRKGNLEEAYREFKKAFECPDFDRQIYPLHLINQHANVCLHLGKPLEARAWFEKVWNGRAERPPERGAKVHAARFLAADAFKNGDLNRGLSIAEAALQKDPQNAELLQNRLRALLDLGRYTEAQAEALRLKDDVRVGGAARAILGDLERGAHSQEQRHD